MTETPRWARQSSVARLADVALRADDAIRGGFVSGRFLEMYRVERRAALDELVRRGAIDRYGFVPSLH